MAEILGSSAWARRIREQIRQVAVHPSNVLITGPTGTGKELIARALHEQSPRASGPFVAVDCAALPADLFVGQLFGHVKGAFTGAHFSSLGAFRAADSGTVFLDEIGEIELPLQAKLLRLLQEHVVVPLGSHQGEPVDVRIIAATNRNLLEEVRAGRFRADLYYRLNVVSLRTEPLATRGEDIEVLATRFLAQLNIEHGLPLKRLAPAALVRLTAYDWPGNVRELLHALERAAVLCAGEVLEAEAFADLPEALEMHAQQAESPSPKVELTAPAATSPSGERPWLSLEELERDHILRTLSEVDYNQTLASSLLKIDRHALRRKIRKHGIALPAPPRPR